MEENKLEKKLDKIIEQQDELIKLLKISNERQVIQEGMMEKYFELHTSIQKTTTGYHKFRSNGDERIKKIKGENKFPWQR